MRPREGVSVLEPPAGATVAAGAYRLVPLVIAVTAACYTSHGAPASGTDSYGADVTSDEAADDAPAEAGVTDAPYPDEDGWDAIRCPDAECPEGMVMVPCGPFVQGSRPGDGVTAAEEPSRLTWLSSFCIQRTEVTVAQYFLCVADGDCDGIDLECNPDVASDRPIRCTVWADRYCAWLGSRLGGGRHVRLPTAAEWEKAARGGCEVVAPADCGIEDERAYPWGNEAPTCERANYAGCVGGVDHVGTRPAGASPYGALDLAGNVAEWVGGDDVLMVPDRRNCGCRPSPPGIPCVDPCCGPACPPGPLSIRGGHYESPAGGVTLSDRGPEMPHYEPREHIGFRCVSELTE